MRFLALILPLVLLTPLAAATPLEYYETIVNLDSDGSNFTFVFLFEQAPDGSLEYFLPFPLKEFETNANFGNYTCDMVPKGEGTSIFCDFGGVAEGGRALNMKFFTPDTLIEIEDKLVFEANVKTPQDVEKMVIKAVLEKGYVLIEEPEEPTTLVPYSPTDGIEGSDGRRIFIEWEREGVKRGEGIDVSVVYESIGPPEREDQNLVFLLIGILILVIAILVGLGSRKRETVDLSLLKGDEKRVMDVVKERGGMCKQRHVVRETDFSKAKVSRLVKDLEERGLIETEKAGRSKKIYLKRSEKKS
ncbi:MAG: MarR family transcriptional regulator [archaeon]|nr:MAG: MarR family transcriptional regulator [archaeon]